MAGLDVTREGIAFQVGTVAKDLEVLNHRVGALKEWLDTRTVDSLTANPMNMDPGDANLYKSVVADLGALMAVYRGEAAQTPAKDFRVFLRQVYGLGPADQVR